MTSAPSSIAAEARAEMVFHREAIASTAGRLVAGSAGITRLAPAAVAGSYVPEVDALRGLAMCAVIIFHCGLMPFGWMGVWLFYVVSGFAVTTSVLAGRGRTASTGTRIWHFYMRRAARIWPLYFAFVAVNVLVLLALGKTGPLEDVPWLLTFSHNFKMMATTYTAETGWPAFGHLWTLAVEQQFYLVFPLLLLLRSRATQGLVLVGLIAAAPLVRAAVGSWAATLGWDPGRIAFTIYAFAPAHFDAFAAGALIALFRQEIARTRRLAYLALTVAVVVMSLHVGVFASIAIAQAHHVTSEELRNIVSGILYGQGREISVYLIPICIGSAVLMGILSGTRICLWLGRLPGLQAIGRVSYGGYLFHVPVLMLLMFLIETLAGPRLLPLSVAGRLGLLALAVPMTVAVAWLSYTQFEQRFMRLRLKYR